MHGVTILDKLTVKKFFHYSSAEMQSATANDVQSCILLSYNNTWHSLSEDYPIALRVQHVHIVQNRSLFNLKMPSCNSIAT
jgi:hypothetical protein